MLNLYVDSFGFTPMHHCYLFSTWLARPRQVPLAVLGASERLQDLVASNNAAPAAAVGLAGVEAFGGALCISNAQETK